jgi:zinc/manganese transport system ATP-binding protein
MNVGETVVSLEKVAVTLGERSVLREVSFKLEAEQFCALIGANGSGKTTLLRAILGFIRLQSGRIERTAEAIGYVPQKITLDPGLPLRARDVVALGLDGARFGPRLPSRARASHVQEMLRAVGAEEFAEQRVGALSGGQQQRVLLAHALVRRPKLLLLDEPLANLDVGSTAAIVALLRQLSHAFGAAVLLSAHDMNPLLPAVDRIVYLANGCAVSGKAEEVVRTEVLSRLYGYHIDVLRVHGRVVVVAAGARDESRDALERDPVHTTTVP